MLWRPWHAAPYVAAPRREAWLAREANDHDVAARPYRLSRSAATETPRLAMRALISPLTRRRAESSNAAPASADLTTTHVVSAFLHRPAIVANGRDGDGVLVIINLQAIAGRRPAVGVCRRRPLKTRERWRASTSPS